MLRENQLLDRSHFLSKVFRAPELDSRKMSYIQFCREFDFLSFDANRAQWFQFSNLRKNGSGFGSGNYHLNHWINSRNGLPISSYQFYFTCFEMSLFETFCTYFFVEEANFFVVAIWLLKKTIFRRPNILVPEIDELIFVRKNFGSTRFLLRFYPFHVTVPIPRNWKIMVTVRISVSFFPEPLGSKHQLLPKRIYTVKKRCFPRYTRRSFFGFVKSEFSYRTLLEQVW
jgi:hypothetical protein